VCSKGLEFVMIGEDGRRKTDLMGEKTEYVFH
jgi:hypothetical protein